MSFEQESRRLTEEAARVLPEAAGDYLKRIRDALLPEGREFAVCWVADNWWKLHWVTYYKAFTS